MYPTLPTPPHPPTPSTCLHMDICKTYLCGPLWLLPRHDYNNKNYVPAVLHLMELQVGK